MNANYTNVEEVVYTFFGALIVSRNNSESYLTTYQTSIWRPRISCTPASATTYSCPTKLGTGLIMLLFSRPRILPGRGLSSRTSHREHDIYFTSHVGKKPTHKRLSSGTRTFNTQSTMTINVVGSHETTFIYCGDQWSTAKDLYDSRYAVTSPLLSTRSRTNKILEVCMAPCGHQRPYGILHH